MTRSADIVTDQRSSARRPVLFVAATSAAAWIGLVSWQLSPAGHLLEHNTSSGATSGVAMAAWFTLSWLLMTAATMLPTSLPLLTAFAHLVGERKDAPRLIAAVVVAFMAVWAAAGLALATIDIGVHQLSEHTALAEHSLAILAATLLIAGTYQLSGTSARCLRACRSPLSFLARRWSGRSAATTEATVVGIDYGISCLGCCAALMLMMFAVGMSSPLVMVGLGGVTALHKHAPWGPAVAKATGVALILAAVLLGAAHVAGGR